MRDITVKVTNVMATRIAATTPPIMTAVLSVLLVVESVLLVVESVLLVMESVLLVVELVLLVVESVIEPVMGGLVESEGGISHPVILRDGSEQLVNTCTGREGGF